MREALVGLLAGWTQLAQMYPWRVGGVGIAIAATILVASAFSVGSYLESKETKVTSGPLFVVSGFIVLGLCVLWALTDWVLVDLLDRMYLEEYLLYALAPDDTIPLEALRLAFSVSPGEHLLMHASTRVPLGLLVATLVYTGIVSWMGRAIAEMKSLEQKPVDILRRERREAARRRKEAEEAGLPIPEDAQVVSLPLSDDRQGRTYKWLGHWTSVERVEQRFKRWQSPMVRSVGTVLGFATPAALMVYLPIPLWVGSTIIVHALLKNLRTPEQPKAEPEPEPAEETEPEVRPPDTRPLDLIKQIENQRGTMKAAPEGLPKQDAVPAEPTKLEARKLLAELMGELGLSSLYAHQGLAADAYADGRNVLVATPPLSGRGIAVDIIMFYALLAEGRGVLYLAEDADAARDAEAEFAARSNRTHWKWNILSGNLSDRAGKLDPDRSQPSLVFADPNSLHQVMLADAERWGTFLAGLGLVVLPDIHRRDGIVASHLMHLLRRLRRAVHRSRAVSGGGELQVDYEQAVVRFIATADPAYRDLGRFAERIVGLPFQVFGPQTDGAPRPAQIEDVVPPAGFYTDHLHPALWVRAAARSNGLTAELFGFEDVLTASEIGEPHPLSKAQLVIARASAERFATLSEMTDHLGHAAEPLRISDVGGISDPHTLVLWVADREPFAEFLATELPAKTAITADPGTTLPGCALVASTQADAVQRAHLRCTLAEDEVALDELARIFSRDLVEQELSALRKAGRLVERIRKILNVDAGRVRDAHTVTLTGAHHVHEEFRLTVAGPAFDLVDYATGASLRALPAVRALAAAYPGKTFVEDGIRYRVLHRDDQDQLKHGRVLAEREEDPILTSPMRRLAVTLLERRLGPDRMTKRERRIEPTRTIGGSPFTLQHRDVKVDEEVLGWRRYAPDAIQLDSTQYDDPIAVQYKTRTTLLGLGELDLNIGVRELHALAHLFRTTLPAFIRHREDDLEIGGIELVTEDDVMTPTVAFIDLHPGGAGFADAVTPEIISHLCRWSLRLLRECPGGCTSETGCPSCLDIWRCHAPPTHFGLLDKRGAIEVLQKLVGDTE